MRLAGLGMALGRVGAMDSLEMINGEDVLENIGKNCRLFAWREPFNI